MQRTIPDNDQLHAEIMERVGSGQSSQEIAEWLSAKLGKKVWRKQVLKIVSEVRAMRRPLQEAAIAEQVGKTTVADLGAIGRLLSDAHEIQVATTKNKPMVALRAIGEQRSLLELRFYLLGMDDPKRKGGNGGSGAPRRGVIILPAEEP